MHASLEELARQHGLPQAEAARLHALADGEPKDIRHTVPLGMAVAAAALLGLGIIFWISANWGALSRVGKFALLQAVIAAMCTGAALRPRARPALALLAMLGIGGLFAFFGQTYQTGADPWQLFALWAALALPLCLAVRHDILWAPWALVAMTAIALWIQAHSAHAWNLRDADLPYHLAGWCMALLIVFALSPGLARATGAGAWGMRVAVTLTAFIVTWSGLFSLLGGSSLLGYMLALLVSGAAAAGLCTARFHDTFALSAIALALNALLVGGLARAVLDNAGSDPIAQTLLIGLSAAGLLAATVKIVLAVARRNDKGAQA